jgi:hypothetical protein
LNGTASFGAAGTQTAYKLDLPKSRFYGDDAPTEQQQQLRNSSSMLGAAADKQQLAKPLQQVAESASPSPDPWQHQQQQQQQQQQQGAAVLQAAGSSGNWVIAAGTASGSSSPSWAQLEGSLDNRGSGFSSGTLSNFSACCSANIVSACGYNTGAVLLSLSCCKGCCKCVCICSACARA